jgi:hypothetical protein
MDVEFSKFDKPREERMKKGNQRRNVQRAWQKS